MIAPLISFALWALTFFGDCTVKEAECHYRYDRHTGDLIITCPQPTVDCSCAGVKP